MSCGAPDDPDCSQVLNQVYEYLDGELSPADLLKIREHLDDCGPCLQQYDLDVALKALVRRSCGCDQAPVELRERILLKISEVRVQLG
ncbi:mycothiol system anti-sigma-R factor [Spongisporangium articulatum]|uniref:Mycothiol system anti-sigma-R factor n=1 Tax=Spongisporangium articulatum TaxID=3362603 RepID=A0ABW8APV3_9ACTN